MAVDNIPSKTSNDSTEEYYAEMEAARNMALDAYFIARPQLLRTHADESIFRAGFERAFSILWNREHALETECVGPPVTGLRYDVVGWACSVCGAWNDPDEEFCAHPNRDKPALKADVLPPPPKGWGDRGQCVNPPPPPGPRPKPPR